MSIYISYWLRLFLISGIIGSVMMIAGDLLYQYIPGSLANTADKMAVLPESRLMAAGVMGLLGSWLYPLAAAQVYVAVLPIGQGFAAMMLVSFAAVMIAYGCSHVAYFAIASGVKASVSLGASAETGARLGNAFFQRLVTIIYIPVAVSSIGMIYAILSGRSLYPFWMIGFQPILLHLLKQPIICQLRGRVREIVHDSYDNLILLVFFGASALTLWNA
jgi:hypothetical protein